MSKKAYGRTGISFTLTFEKFVDYVKTMQGAIHYSFSPIIWSRGKLSNVIDFSSENHIEILKDLYEKILYLSLDKEFVDEYDFVIVIHS